MPTRPVLPIVPLASLAPDHCCAKVGPFVRNSPKTTAHPILLSKIFILFLQCVVGKRTDVDSP